MKNNHFASLSVTLLTIKRGGWVPSELSLRDNFEMTVHIKEQQKESRQTYISLKSSFHQLSKNQHFEDIA